MFGKEEGKVSGAKEGTYVVLNGRRVIAITASRLGNNDLVLEKRFTSE